MIKHKNTRNPILPVDIHIPDSEAHVFSDGSLYIYGSYDNQPDQYCSDKYFVVSTKDMEKWEISDLSFHGKDVPWVHDPNAVTYGGIDWSNPSPFIKKVFMKNLVDRKIHDMKKSLRGVMQSKESKLPANFGVDKQSPDLDNRELLYAPDCIERDGKYYLYFCMSDNSEGVAVSDSPKGPFTDPIQLPVGGIDPAIFIDDDGSAYYYWGQLFSHGVKLNPDMTSFDPEQIVDDLVTVETHFFHEGSSMRKIGDTYYYVYADMERGRPTALGYATSKSPLGPFTYRGIIIDNADCDPQSWNNHGSIECINGQWYVFYHRCSRDSQQYRRLCIEPITILEDGSIPEVKMTSQGTGKPFEPGEIIRGYHACELHGKCFIDTAKTAKGNPTEKLTNLHEGDDVHFRYIHSESEIEQLLVKAKGSGIIEVFCNEIYVGMIEVRNGKQIRKTISAPGGTYDLRLKITESKRLEIFALKFK